MAKKSKLKILLIFEYIGFVLMYNFFRILPFDIASNIGSFIGRKIGIYTRETRNARENLKNIMPELSEVEREKIVIDMWDNLGRNVGELSHIDKIDKKRITVEGLEYIDKNQSAIFVSGHFGNWEICNLIAKEYLLNPAIIYTEIKNPYVQKEIKKFRERFYSQLFLKGENAIKIAKNFKKGMHLCLLIDQKIKNGIPVDFFGREAMTSPAVAHFSKRYNLPIIPVRILREGKKFKINIYPPLDIEENSIDEIMLKINKTIEGWVRGNPSQWFWVHKRWNFKKGSVT